MAVLIASPTVWFKLFTVAYRSNSLGGWDVDVENGVFSHVGVDLSQVVVCIQWFFHSGSVRFDHHYLRFYVVVFDVCLLVFISYVVDISVLLSSLFSSSSSFFVQHLYFFI